MGTSGIPSAQQKLKRARAHRAALIADVDRFREDSGPLPIRRGEKPEEHVVHVGQCLDVKAAAKVTQSRLAQAGN